MKVWDPSKNDESQLWLMAAISFVVFYSNYMVPPLIPALSREFSVSPYQLGWLIPGFLYPLWHFDAHLRSVIGSLGTNSRARNSSPLSVTPAMMMVSFAGSWRTLIIARILSGVGCGGIVTISLAVVGDRYP